jgi:hypothetical protein
MSLLLLGHISILFVSANQRKNQASCGEVFFLGSIWFLDQRSMILCFFFAANSEKHMSFKFRGL